MPWGIRRRHSVAPLASGGGANGPEADGRRSDMPPNASIVRESLRQEFDGHSSYDVMCNCKA